MANERITLDNSILENLRAQTLVPMVTDDGLMIGNSGCRIGKYGMIWESPEADMCTVTYRNNKWMMIHDEGVPTMDADDCICEFETLDEAVEASKKYLMGKPELLEGWNVPLHKHPDWNRNQIVTLINHAEHFPEGLWKPFREYLEKEENNLISAANMGHEVKNKAFDAVQVIPVRHSNNPKQTLWIFRDLKQAAIVTSES
jgi:hypothetical protein